MIRIVLLGSLILTANVLASCDSKPTSTSAPPPAVTVSHPLQKSITEWDEYIGRFTPLETVEIRARVSGFIDSVHFREGQIVKKDDLLFVIDQRPYQIAVEQAKADIERAQAKLDIATQDVNRATPLIQNQTLTVREFDTRKSVERDASGQLASANAALKQAQLNLEWTEVRAPIAGRISDKRVDAGNLITGGQTGATLLSVIVSIDPIHFVFDGSESDFLHYLRLAAAGTRPSSRDAPNPVAVRLAAVEHKVDGIDRHDDAQERSAGLSAANEVAGIDALVGNAAGNGRANLGPLEIKLRLFQGGVSGGELAGGVALD